MAVRSDQTVFAAVGWAVRHTTPRVIAPVSGRFATQLFSGVKRPEHVAGPPNPAKQRGKRVRRRCEFSSSRSVQNSPRTAPAPHLPQGHECATSHPDGAAFEQAVIQAGTKMNVLVNIRLNETKNDGPAIFARKKGGAVFSDMRTGMVYLLASSTSGSPNFKSAATFKSH